MNKITIILKESGTIAELQKNFNLYRGSSQNVQVSILVPKSIVQGRLLTQYVGADGDIQTQNGMYTSVKLGMVYVQGDGKLGKTRSYYVRYIQENGNFLEYSRMLPSEFCQVTGVGENAPKLVINVENILNNITVGSDGETIINTPTVVSLITSQTCSLDVYPSTSLDVDEAIEPSELELIDAEVNALIQGMGQKANIVDTVLKFNVQENMPNAVLYSKDSYKSVGVLFYNEVYTVPITKNSTESKCGSVIVTDVRPHDTEPYWVLQDELFTYDKGAVKRTITINAVQQPIGQYTVVNVGDWQPVNADWLNEMDARVVENTADIDSLMGRSSRYVVHLGDNTSPSQEELQDAFEETSGMTTPLDGTTLLDLDNNKEYTYFTSNGLWNDRGSSTVSLFTETSAGTIKSSTKDGYVSSASGEGKVNGWEQVKADLQTNATNIGTKVSKTDLTKVAVDKALAESVNGVQIRTSYKDLTDNSTTQETLEIVGENGVLEVSAEGNKIILDVNPDGASLVKSVSLDNGVSLTPQANKNINLPAFVRTDSGTGTSASSGVVSAEQADLIAFKADAQSIAENAVNIEKTRAMQVEAILNGDITTNAQNIANNTTEIADIKADYVPKANFTDTLVTADDFAVSSTGALQHTETKVNASTGEVSTEQKTAVPVVNGQARLFLPQEQETLQELDQWRASMQGDALSYQTDLSDIPSGETSSAEVQNYLTQKYYALIGKQQEPLDQTTITDESIGVTYKWYSNDDLWYLSHGAPSSLATNNMYDSSGSLTSGGSAGVIVGSNRKYHGLIETNGELAVNGLDALDERVQNNSTAINNEVTNRQNAVQQETQRAQVAEQANATAISNEVSRAQGVESELNSKITAETTRATSAEQAIADDLSAEITRATTAEQANVTALTNKVDKTTTVAGKPLSGNITLETLTLQQNNKLIGTFDGSASKTYSINTPTKTSDITNDGDGTQVSGNADPYAKVSQVPTKTSQLQNDSSFATISQIPTKTSDLTNDGDGSTSGDGYAKQSALNNLQTQINEISNGLTLVDSSVCNGVDSISEIFLNSLESSNCYKIVIKSENTLPCKLTLPTGEGRTTKGINVSTGVYEEIDSGEFLLSLREIDFNCINFNGALKTLLIINAPIGLFNNEAFPTPVYWLLSDPYEPMKEGTSLENIIPQEGVEIRLYKR